MDGQGDAVRVVSEREVRGCAQPERSAPWNVTTKPYLFVYHKPVINSNVGMDYAAIYNADSTLCFTNYNEGPMQDFVGVGSTQIRSHASPT